MTKCRYQYWDRTEDGGDLRCTADHVFCDYVDKTKCEDYEERVTPKKEEKNDDK